MKTIIAIFLMLPFAAFSTPIKFAEQVVNFSPTNTAEVGRAFIAVRCLRSGWAWENSKDAAKVFACNGFKVNGQTISKYNYEKAIEMKKLGPNQFELPKVEVEYSTAMKGHACFRILTALETGKFEAPLDEWSLLGFCTVDKLPFPDDREIYENHRVKTLNEFKNALNNPIQIKTKPL